MFCIIWVDRFSYYLKLVRRVLKNCPSCWICCPAREFFYFGFAVQFGERSLPTNTAEIVKFEYWFFIFLRSIFLHHFLFFFSFFIMSLIMFFIFSLLFFPQLSCTSCKPLENLYPRNFCWSIDLVDACTTFANTLVWWS